MSKDKDPRHFREKVVSEFENGGEGPLVKAVYAVVMTFLIAASALLSIPIGIAKFVRKILRR